MPAMWMDVDAALTAVPVNIVALIDDSDFKSREESVTYDQAGIDLVWNFVTTAGAYTQTAVTPTTSGVHDWVNQGNGMYSIEIPASGGTIDNDTTGFGWFTGFATGILPWTGPVIIFRAAGINDKLCDWLYSQARGLAGTALPNANADAAYGLPTSDAGGLNMDGILASLVQLQQSSILLITAQTGGTATTTQASMAEGPDNNNDIIGALVVLQETGKSYFVSRTITDYATANHVITFAPALEVAAKGGGTIYIVPGDTTINVTADAILTDTNELQTNQGNWVTATGFLTQANVRTAVGLASANLDTQLGTLSTHDAAAVKTAIEAGGSSIAQILADTGELQIDDIPGTLVTIAGYLDTEIAAIKAVTDVNPDSGALTTINTNTVRLTAVRAAVLTDWIDDGRLDALLDAIPTTAMRGTNNASTHNAAAVKTAIEAGGSHLALIKTVTDALTAAAAAKLALSAAGIVSGVVESGTLSTTQMTTDLAETTPDHYIGAVIVWTSGPLAGQRSDVTDYSGVDGLLTFTEVTDVPQDGNTFVII